MKWKNLNKYYAVSNTGIIKVLQHEFKNRWGGISIRNEKILSQSNDKNGYKLVTMKKLGINKNGQYRVHRIVAMCWLKDYDEKLEINHIDGNKQNNNIENLECVTSKENKQHALSVGLMKIGKEHHFTKTIVGVKDNRQIILNGTKEIRDFGFNPGSVNRVASGKRKTYKGWKFEYKK